MRRIIGTIVGAPIIIRAVIRARARRAQLPSTAGK